MEKQVMIVTDSTAYLTEEEIERYDIYVIPLKVIFGTEVYDEGKNITNREFYRRIRNGAVPTTSQPARSDFTQIYEELVGGGIRYFPCTSPVVLVARLVWPPRSRASSRRRRLKSSIRPRWRYGCWCSRRLRRRRQARPCRSLR